MLVIGVMILGNWQQHTPRELRPQPQIIKAQLIELETQAPAQAKPKTEVIDLTAQRERERKAEEQRKLAQRKRDEEEKRKLEEQRRKEEAKKKAEQEKQRLAELERQKREQELEQRRLSDFEQALQAEESYQAQLQEQQLVASIGAEIERAVELNWSRPPSARLGMQAVLRVSLVPTGGLSAVEVLESSGDAAFDRSANQAVRKAAPFEIIREISPVVFEKNFRTFQFRFSPQDLRL